MFKLIYVPDKIAVILDDQGYANIMRVGLDGNPVKKPYADIIGTDVLQYDNVPTGGIKLTDSDKMEYACNTISDPRGFKVNLETMECERKIDSEYVYGWQVIAYGDGMKPEPLLLPVNSLNYEMAMRYSDYIKSGKTISDEDLIPGAKYLRKDMTQMTFLEKVPHYCSSFIWYDDTGKKRTTKHWDTIPTEHRKPKDQCQKITVRGERYIFVGYHKYMDGDRERVSISTLYEFKTLEEAQIKWCLNDIPTPDLEELLKALHKYQNIFPADYTGDVWHDYTPELFSDLCMTVREKEQEKEREGFGFYNYQTVFSPADGLNPYEEYKIVYDAEKNMWKIVKTHNINRYDVGMSPFDEVLDMADTPDELYGWLKPRYQKIMLTSGVVYNYVGAPESLACE